MTETLMLEMLYFQKYKDAQAVKYKDAQAVKYKDAQAIKYKDAQAVKYNDKIINVVSCYLYNGISTVSYLFTYHIHRRKKWY